MSDTDKLLFDQFMSERDKFEVTATRLRGLFHSALAKEDPDDFTVVFVCTSIVAEVLAQTPEPERKRRTKGVGLMLRDMLATIAKCQAEVLQ